MGFIFLGEGRLSYLTPVIWGFALFSLGATTGYALNDLADAQGDKSHPLHTRRRRSLVTAIPFPILLVGGIIFGLRTEMVSPLMAGLVVGYLLLSVLYTHFFKKIPLLELLILATLFLLRVLAGTWGVGIPPSSWLVIAAFLMALLLGVGKRLAERRRGLEGFSFRPVLNEYPESFLLGMTRMLVGLNFLVYLLYAVDHPERDLLFLLSTLPFVAYGLFRYLLIVETREDAPSPEALLLSDKPSLLNLALWLLVVWSTL